MNSQYSVTDTELASTQKNDESLCCGWSETIDETSLKPLPYHMSSDWVKLVVPMTRFDTVVTNLPIWIRNMNVHAIYVNDPLTIKIVTETNVTMVLYLWGSRIETEDDDVFYVDVHRTGGDAIDANRYTHMLLDLIQTGGEEEDEELYETAHTTMNENRHGEFISQPSTFPISETETTDQRTTPPSNDIFADFDLSNATMDAFRTIENLIIAGDENFASVLDTLAGLTDTRTTFPAVAVSFASAVLFGNNLLPGPAESCALVNECIVQVLTSELTNGSPGCRGTAQLKLALRVLAQSLEIVLRYKSSSSYKSFNGAAFLPEFDIETFFEYGRFLQDGAASICSLRDLLVALVQKHDDGSTTTEKTTTITMTTPCCNDTTMTFLAAKALRIIGTINPRLLFDIEGKKTSDDSSWSVSECEEATTTKTTTTTTTMKPLSISNETHAQWRQLVSAIGRSCHQLLQAEGMRLGRILNSAS